jgi:hypothetical protein
MARHLDARDRLRRVEDAARRMGIEPAEADRELLAAEVRGLLGAIEALWAAPLPPALSGWRDGPSS